MNELKITKKTANDIIWKYQIYYDSIFDLNGRAYNELRNCSFECYELENFDSFVTDMTQGQFYTIWKIFSNLKVRDLFFTNSDKRKGEAIEITMPSFIFYQLNSLPWFKQLNDEGIYYDRILHINSNSVPDMIKDWINSSEENKFIWELMHYDLTQVSEFQKFLKFRNDKTNNPELFLQLKKKYGI